MICSIDRESITHSVTDVFQLNKASSNCPCMSLVGAGLGDVWVTWDVLPPVWGVSSALHFRSLLDEKLKNCEVCSTLQCETPHTKSLGKFSGPPSRITGFGQAGLASVLCFVFFYIWANCHWHIVLRCSWTINKY